MLSTDSVKVARSVGLRYVSDNRPGVRRDSTDDGFLYLDKAGNRIEDPDELDRFKALGIPPAWTEVWICPHANGHLQATGRDAKGRKQYRYHVEWCKVRNQSKFERMARFGASLPQIREQTDRHTKQRGLGREKVLATIVQLLEKTLIRVGNNEYAEKNDSFGLTTLRDDHLEVEGSTLRFSFRGKSGVEHEIEVGDRRLAKIVKHCQDLPGQELFQYYDENGEQQVVDSRDVNAYLQEVTGEDFTAKDFRTWFGTVYALLELQDVGPATSPTDAKKKITNAIKRAASQLGNRPATCKKYYVHPQIMEAFQTGELFPILEECQRMGQPSSPYELTAEERAILIMLEQASCAKAA